MSDKVYIAVDPGKSGGISWKIDDIVECCGMPDTETDIADLFKRIKEEAGNRKIECVLESVHAMPGQGVSSTFTFGQNFGFIKGVIITLGIRLTMITPQKWIKDIGAGTSKDLSKTEWKNKLKGLAQQLYPDQKVTLKVSDSLLILEWAEKNT